MHALKLILTNKKYFSVVWVFSSLNVIIGTWVLYIPYVKTKLSLNDAQIGFALFCTALGIMSFLPVLPYLIKKIGVGRLTCIGVIVFAFAFIFPLLMPSYSSLCLSLFTVGVFSGITDIAMNALVSEIEKRDAINIMSSAHGFFSLGGVLGAAFGTVLMPIIDTPFYHMLIISGFVIIINLSFVKHYFSILERQQSKGKTSFSFNKIKSLLAIAFIALVVMSNEGAIEHWSSLYFKEIIKVDTAHFAGIGFLMFSIFMTLGRFFGDAVSEKIGSVKIIFYGSILAVLGYLCVLYGMFISAVIGFGVIGLGLSVIVPEVFRMAGSINGVKPSVGISMVSGIGFAGFLLGPIILGYISNSFNLKTSFLTLLILLCLVVLITMFFLSQTKTNKN